MSGCLSEHRAELMRTERSGLIRLAQTWSNGTNKGADMHTRTTDLQTHWYGLFNIHFFVAPTSGTYTPENSQLSL